MSRVQPAPPVKQPLWLSYSGLLLPIFLFFDFVLLSLWGYGGDWLPIWVAGRLAWSDPARLYDFAEVTKLQLPILGGLGIRPFVYPPSTLALLAPLSLLPFRSSLACISIGGALLLALSSSRAETNRILLLVSPPVVFAAMIGQPTLLVAGLIVLALTRLESNEAWAGVLLALAAMLKPTLLLMAPFGLVAGRHWRAVATAAATGALVIAASITLFGLGAWETWFEALPRFQAIFDASPALYRNGITPYAAMLYWGYAAKWVIWAAIPLAILVTLMIFMRSGGWRTRMVAVVGGSLLVSPYAMNYELAALAPVVFTMRRERLYDLAVPIVWAAALFANASLLGLLAVYLWAIVRLVRPSIDDRGVECRVDITSGHDDNGPIIPGRLAA